MGLTKHPDKPKGECVMEFRDKPMQNLIRIKEKEICKNVQELLLDGEQIVGAYKTVRDQAVFTTHRIFMVDMQAMRNSSPPIRRATLSGGRFSRITRPTRLSSRSPYSCP